MRTHGVRPGSDVPSKATIFCPRCDHRGRFDGDWTVVDTGRTTRYRCPECGAAVDLGSSPVIGRAVHAFERLWTWQRRLDE